MPSVSVKAGSAKLCSQTQDSINKGSWHLFRVCVKPQTRVSVQLDLLLICEREKCSHVCVPR